MTTTTVSPELTAALIAAREAIELGIEYLNETKPKWRDNVDLDKLDESSSNFCIYAQALKTGYMKHREKHNDPATFDAWAIERGFTVTTDALVDFDAMTELWRAAIMPGDKDVA